MSDITSELVEAAKSRDARLKLIAEGVTIQSEMRDSPTIRYILRQVTTDADSAMEELAETSPLDNVSIAKLLVKIQTYVYIRKSLENIQLRADLAAQQVRAEDMSEGLDV
jgi:hypothetical protein